MSYPDCLLDALANIPDPRDRRGIRHPLSAVLGLAVLAMLSGCKGYAAIAQFGRDKGFALAHALGFRRGKTPTKSTYSVLFRRLDVLAFEAALGRWIAARLSPEQATVLALDGKVLRGSRDGAVPGQHLVAVYAPAASAVLAQVRVDAKTNEHKAALELLGILSVRGRVVTGDAMFCQRDLCRAIVDGGGDYVFTVKDNQPSLAIDIQAGLSWEDQQRRRAAIFSPRRHVRPAAAGEYGDDRRQRARAAGETHLATDDGSHQVSGLGGLAARVRVNAGTDHPRPNDPGDRVRHHKPGDPGRNRGPTVGPDPRPLGHRERAALQTGRDVG